MFERDHHAFASACAAKVPMFYRDHLEPEDLSTLTAALKGHCDLNLILPGTLEWDALAQRALFLFHMGIRTVDELALRLSEGP